MGRGGGCIESTVAKLRKMQFSRSGPYKHRSSLVQDIPADRFLHLSFKSPELCHPFSRSSTVLVLSKPMMSEVKDLGLAICLLPSSREREGERYESLSRLSNVREGDLVGAGAGFSYVSRKKVERWVDWWIDMVFVLTS